ncbi:MAG: lytic murein transglycosylase [Bradyrhizobiaceae bacterium]|nr:lytic murein transglycosylase [Bradyrhizobiaceae bacterium]
MIPFGTSAQAQTARCGNDAGGFPAWLAVFQREAAAEGISPRAIAALDGVTYNPGVVALDRRQGVFKQSFEQFAGRMVSQQRLQRGAQLLRQHAGTLKRIEGQFGVPGPVIVAIWGLETDFGANMGKQPSLRALATLAYDCRRAEFFTRELLAALRIIDRGDLAPPEMRGAWAGELGQMQFLPSSYVKFAVDFDGNGRRDLIRSSADALASTANYLKGYGWRAGAGWNEGAPNFAVLREWNKAQVYQRTIALFATRLSQ